MSRKSPKIAELIRACQGQELPAHYLGYFECFNRGLYYEAHDVLEELWLREGRQGENYGFYKGLIQFAGGFVHLQKGRLRPAVALFKLSRSYLEKYPSPHQYFDIAALLEMNGVWVRYLEQNDYSANPLGRLYAPKLVVPCSAH